MNKHKEYITSNGLELYNWLFANPETIEEISNLMVMHWKDPNKMALSVKQQIETDIDQEPEDETGRRIYG